MLRSRRLVPSRLLQVISFNNRKIDSSLETGSGLKCCFRWLHDRRESRGPLPHRIGGARFWFRFSVVSAIGVGGSLAWFLFASQTLTVPECPFERKTLVVLGTGWGSMSFLRSLEAENYKVVVISQRNYFLFTPLLPSCATGLIEHRSIMEPIRNFIHRRNDVEFYEGEAIKIDHEQRTVHVKNPSAVDGQAANTQISFDMLVVGVGADNATFNIPGVEQHSCFLKSVPDVQKIRGRIMDCIETALLQGQSQDEFQRLLRVVVVGGGPTGVEFAAELQDFYEDDLKAKIPSIKNDFQITLIEALPNVLPMFSKNLIQYAEATLKENSIEVMTKAAVKEVNEKDIKVEITTADGTKNLETIPYGLLVWATGNKPSGLVQDLSGQIPEQNNSRRGFIVDEYLAVKGCEWIWAIGDCANSNLPPTAQVAAQQGAFLARAFNNMAKNNSLGDETAETFQYSHQGSLAYIGQDLAVADLNLLGKELASQGFLTYIFWKAAYLKMCFTARSRFLVATDWMKARIFGRDLCKE